VDYEDRFHETPIQSLTGASHIYLKIHYFRAYDIGKYVQYYSLILT